MHRITGKVKRVVYLTECLKISFILRLLLGSLENSGKRTVEIGIVKKLMRLPKIFG